MPVCEVTGCRSKKRVVERDDGTYLCDPCELVRLRRAEASRQDINNDERDESDHEGNDDVSDRHYYDDDGHDESDGRGDDDEYDDEETDGAADLVANELLTYAFTYIDNSSPEMLIKTIEEFYSDNEIHDAKETLWQVYGPVLKGTKSRRSGSVRTAAKAEVEDIILNGVLALRNKDIEMSVQFCALNIKRLPRFSPEEINMQTILNRVAKLEMQMKGVQDQCSHNAARITVVDSERSGPAYSNVVSGGVSVPSGGFQRPADNETANGTMPSKRSTPYLTGEERLQMAQGRPIGGVPTNTGSSANGRLMPSVSTQHSTGATSGTSAVPGAGSSAVTAGKPLPGNSTGANTRGQGKNNEGDQWSLQRHERRKRIKEAIKSYDVVVGSKSDSGLECGYEAKCIFVFNVNKKYKECDISDYMKNNGVSVLKIKEISHKEATNKSFRVIIKAADYEKAMSSQFWVEGIKCREWVQWIDVNTCSCIVCCSILCVSSHH